jgi:hypothetical protein
VISSLHRRHRSTEFRKFLNKIDKQVPADLEVHLIADNYATNLFKCRQEIGSAAMIFQAPIGFAPTPPVASLG